LAMAAAGAGYFSRSVIGSKFSGGKIPLNYPLDSSNFPVAELLQPIVLWCTEFE